MPIEDSFACSIWNDGRNGWGIRFGKAVGRFFDEHQKQILVELDGVQHSFQLTNTFWTTCPEIRGKAIRYWLEKHGVGWHNKKRFRVVMEVVEVGKRFRARLEPREV